MIVDHQYGEVPDPQPQVVELEFELEPQDLAPPCLACSCKIASGAEPAREQEVWFGFCCLLLQWGFRTKGPAPGGFLLNQSPVPKRASLSWATLFQKVQLPPTAGLSVTLSFCKLDSLLMLWGPQRKAVVFYGLESVGFVFFLGHIMSEAQFSN